MRQTILEVLIAAFGCALVVKGCVGLDTAYQEIYKERLERNQAMWEWIREGYGR